MDRLLVCYVPGMDLRRIDRDSCPFTSRRLTCGPWVRLQTYPTTEHVATMLTGVPPDAHGCWGPRLKAPSPRTLSERLVDLLPDFASTTVQGLRHLFAGPYDLATMPPRRRRRFEWVRFKFVKHAQFEKVVLEIGGLPSIFTIVGEGQGRYVYHDDLRNLDRLLGEIANARYALEMVEVHCLDRLQHWCRYEGPDLSGYYRRVDDFLAAVHAKCRERRTGLVIVSDHGMEPVHRWIDVVGEVRATGVPPETYECFVENTKATFWFQDDDAAGRITARLAACAHLTPLTRAEMRRYDLDLEPCFGDLYVYPDPGTSLFPNDFHRPLASKTLSLLDWQQRPRFRDPRHRGDHGYRPENECENGFLLLAHEGFEAPKEAMTLLEVAPSILWLLGRPQPETMRGRSAFQNSNSLEGSRPTG